jgi:PAS domain S-box-containing protein
MRTTVSQQAEVGNTSAASAKRPISVTELLRWLVLACLLPTVIGVSAYIYVDFQNAKARLVNDLAQSARTKMQTVDVQLAHISLFADALSTSGTLTRQDLAAFHRRALILLKKENEDFAVVLFDKTSQQLVHTNLPWGQPLPQRHDLEPVRYVFASGHAAKPTLIFRATDGLPMIRTLVPVFSGQHVMYALAVSFVPEKFSSIVSPLGLPSESTTTIIDSTGTIAARSHDPDQFIGQKVEPEIWAQFQQNPEGSFVTHPKKNVQSMYATYSRSPETGFHVLVTTPRDAIYLPLILSLKLMAESAVLILVLSLVLVWFVGRRIILSVDSIKTAAIAFGHGETINSTGHLLLEAHDAAQAFNRATRQLAARSQQLLESNDALRERSAELAEAQQITQMGNWSWDFKNSRIVASDELFRQFGMDVLNSFEAKDGKVFPPDAQQKIDEAIKDSIQTGSGYSLELQIFNNKGGLVWVNARGQPVFDDTGEIIGLRGTLQNISRHKSAENSLRENKTRLQMALSSSDLALWDWHIQSDDLFFDERWAAIQGYTLNELTFRHDRYMQDIFQEDKALIQKNLAAHFNGGSPKYESIYRVRHKDGHCLWIQGTGKIVEWDAEGRPSRMLGVALDVTERMHKEKKMAALHDEMNAMLVWQVGQHTVAALAHEINQPLACVSILSAAASRMALASELSADGVGNMPNRLQETLKSISSEIERAGIVLRNLLVSVSQPNITRQSVMLSELLSEAIQTALEEGVFGFKIITDDAADLPRVQVNRLQVKKVLLNLIHNSAQAMQAAQSPNGKIEIKTALSDDGREIIVTVEDEGPGVNAMLLSEIFQPYISTKAHGLGLGLTISRSLIEAQGGRLWVTQAEGRGAAFHFTLPATD